MKTLLIIFALGFLIPCTLFLLVHFRNWSKAFAKIRWWTVIYFVGIFGILTQWIMFFPAWFCSNLKFNPFWIWLDDERFKIYPFPNRHKIYSQDYYEFLNGREETIWTAYKWHMRNRVWNLDSLLRPRKGERKIKKIVVDKLTMYFKKVDQRQDWIPMARLKYWKDGKDGNQVNSGEFISIKYSIFGKGYVWEKIGKRLTFRYSFLKSFLGRWLLFISGENDKRFVLSLKWKRKKTIL